MYSTMSLEVDDEIDRVIFWTNADDELTVAESVALRVGLIGEAFYRHRDACLPYARFVERQGFAETTISEQNLHLIPQLPTTLFKRADVRSSTSGADGKRCTSSGTAGSVSTVWRDRTTLERLCGSVRSGLGLIGSFREDDTVVLNLGPDVDQAGDLWYAYVMGLVELLFPTEHCWSADDGLDVEHALLTVQALMDEAPHVGVVGPPFLVERLARAALASGTVLPADRVTVVTGGGWKRTPNPLARTEFRTLAADAFKIRPSAVRDTFNQVELNTVLVECRAHRLHVPPWLEVIIRDPADLVPVPHGEVGLASYLDPTAASYPCFIIADDLARYNEGMCECGRTARWVEFVRRIRRDETRGCAAVLDASEQARRGDS
jgi:long-chain-fatty-acid---luciferin-component ligase